MLKDIFTYEKASYFTSFLQILYGQVFILFFVFFSAFYCITVEKENNGQCPQGL